MTIMESAKDMIPTRKETTAHVQRGAGAGAGIGASTGAEGAEGTDLLPFSPLLLFLP